MSIKQNCFIAALMLPHIVLAQNEPETSALDVNAASASLSFIDGSHEFISSGSDSVVQWVDGFFGVPRTDLESADSFLRLRIDHEWDEKNGSSFGQRLRGKVLLPRLNERLGLIFSDEDGDESSDKNSLQQALSNDSSSNDVALQYTSIDGEHSRMDYRVGFRSSLQIKVAARYRYELGLSEMLKLRLSEEVYFRDGNGFGEKTVFDLDRVLDSNKVIRWSTRAEFGQETQGVEWGSSLALSRRIDDKSAISYFASVEGSTRPNYTNRGYGLGMTYRRNWFREWIFYEIEPVYLWRRDKIEAIGQTAYFEGREGVAQLTLRLEIHFVEN